MGGKDMNLLEAIREWMVNYKQTSVKPATYDRLVGSAKLMENYEVSSIPIEDLTVNDLQKYVNSLVYDGYALTTIKKQIHLISGYIGYANLYGIITKPIHKGVRLPSESVVKKPKRQVVAYTQDEQKALKQIFWSGESPAYYAALMMLETGMRVGEALALTWLDIDWNRKAVRISKTVVRLGDSGRSYVQDGAKSFTSNRTIPLSKDAYDLLKWMKTNDSDQSGFIFHNTRGDHLTYEALRWWIKRACDEAGVPYYGQHVFRHTFATNCYEKGCNVKVLSKFLGHADVSITYNIYIHLFGDAVEEMRSIVG